ncbi:hypothetical protein BT69DRAFT_521414 [Atractiella rhizophila]|nr:hypothetical protein BT69DRAFT_521414 [Atractiella rhizophila]
MFGQRRRVKTHHDNLPESSFAHEEDGPSPSPHFTSSSVVVTSPPLRGPNDLGAAPAQPYPPYEHQRFQHSPLGSNESGHTISPPCSSSGTPSTPLPDVFSQEFQQRVPGMPQNFPSRFEYPKNSTYQPQGSPEYRPRPFPAYRPPPRPVSSEFFYGVKQETEQGFFPMKAPAMEQRRNPPLYPQVHPALRRLELTPVLYSTAPPLVDRIGRTNIPRPSLSSTLLPSLHNPSLSKSDPRSFYQPYTIHKPRFTSTVLTLQTPDRHNPCHNFLPTDLAHPTNIPLVRLPRSLQTTSLHPSSYISNPPLLSSQPCLFVSVPSPAIST